MVETTQATPESPVYSYMRDPNTRNMYVVCVDEGWRSSVVCAGMYEWATRWLVDELQGKPFALETRP